MPSFTMFIDAMFDGDTPLDAFLITIESTKTIPLATAEPPRDPAWYDANNKVQLLEPNQKVEDVFTVELIGTKVQVLIQQG
ncbi:hypothetical protein BGZ97_008965, partial [Linnemannia gamsii]